MEKQTNTQNLVISKNKEKELLAIKKDIEEGKIKFSEEYLKNFFKNWHKYLDKKYKKKLK